MRVTQTHRARAMRQLSSWRREDVPLLVTAHEAHRLSNGLIGTEDDHATPISLARVALAVQA